MHSGKIASSTELTRQSETPAKPPAHQRQVRLRETHTPVIEIHFDERLEPDVQSFGRIDGLEDLGYGLRKSESGVSERFRPREEAARLRVEKIASFVGEMLLKIKRQVVFDVDVGDLMGLDEAASRGPSARRSLPSTLGLNSLHDVTPEKRETEGDAAEVQDHEEMVDSGRRTRISTSMDYFDRRGRLDVLEDVDGRRRSRFSLLVLPCSVRPSWVSFRLGLVLGPFRHHAVVVRFTPTPLLSFSSVPILKNILHPLVVIIIVLPFRRLPPLVASLRVPSAGSWPTIARSRLISV